MTTSRRPSRTAGRNAKPDSLRAAHQQITQNSGTLADIANLIELEGRGNPARRQTDQPLRSQPASGKPAAKSSSHAKVQANSGSFLEQRPFGIPIAAILLCALIVGAAVGVPLGVLTYGTAIYTAVVDSLAVL